MSSKARKSKTKERSESGDPQDWSEWCWDGESNQWYRTLALAEGGYHYEYRAAEAASSATPRDHESSSHAINTFVDNRAANTGYTPEFTEYGYNNRSESVETLTGAFSAASIGAVQRPVPPHSNSYNENAYSGYGGRQAIPMPVNSSGPAAGGGDAIYSMSAPDTYQNPYASMTAIQPLPTPTWNSTGGFPNANAAPGSPSGYGSQQNEVARATTGSLEPEGKVITTETTAEDHEKFDPRYQVHKSHSFKPGKVFMVLWSEPQGATSNETVTEVTRNTIRNSFGEKTHTKIRRFIIVKSGRGFSLCVPIVTYGHQATAKAGINRDDHAVVYMGKKAPALKPGEGYLEKEPIQIIATSPRDKLLSDSRINYAKIYTVEHNVKVHFIGNIAKESLRTFHVDFDATYSKGSHLEY